MIYFDNNATTPLVPTVIHAMNAAMASVFGNPSSAHSAGRLAATLVTEAREEAAALIGADDPECIVFTSGGTESDNWAISGVLRRSPKKKHIVTTRAEHEAVRKLAENHAAEGTAVSWVEVDRDGNIDIDKLCGELRPETALVSVMWANNETGVVFPVREIAHAVKERSDAIVHVDAVNAAGKVPIDLRDGAIDLLSLSAHKFHGPKGVGALYVRRGIELPSLLIGGGQESGRRAGTEAVHQIAGLGAAAKYVRDMSGMEKVRGLRDRLENGILKKIPNSRLNGTSDQSKRLPNTSNISFENTNGEMIMSLLDEHGVCVSTGSACNAADHRASAVLQAMDIPYSWAMGSIRFSLSRLNTEAEVDTVLEILPEIVAGLRSLA